MESARPAATSAAAAFNNTTSRRGDFFPSNISRMISVFAFASPPEMLSMGATVNPNCSGESHTPSSSRREPRRLFVGPEIDISSRPSRP